MVKNIKINCHSSICIDGDIYIDPFNINEEYNNAKVIFITHSHYDHLDINSIKNIIKIDTKIVCTKDSSIILKQEGIKNDIIIVKPNEKGEVCGIQFSTFPAYNFGHHHLKEYSFVGYTLIIDNVRYTICGDTDATPELENVKTDVLLIPIGGTYTMDAKEAGELTNKINPKVAIPTHYNFIKGTAGKEAEKIFQNVVNNNIKTEILIK